MGVQEEPIVNRVANSALITINLEDYYQQGERVALDLKPLLYQELILREKDFRGWVKEHDWQQYEGKNVAVHCTADAIIPLWATMLVLSKLEPHVNHAVAGNLPELENALFQQALQEKLDLVELTDAKVVIKGCGHLPIPAFAYAEATRLLTPVVQAIMYGEPCSTVPVYKRPKVKAGA